MYNEIIRNVLVTVISVILVIIILALIGYYLIPYLWDKLNINELILQKIKEMIGL